MLSLHSCRNASRLLLRAQEYTLQSLELFRQVCSHLSGGMVLTLLPEKWWTEVLASML